MVRYEQMLCEQWRPMWQIPGAVLCVYVGPVVSGKALTGLRSSVFRSLTGSGMDGSGVAAGDGRWNHWLGFRNDVGHRREEGEHL